MLWVTPHTPKKNKKNKGASCLFAWQWANCRNAGSRTEPVTLIWPQWHVWLVRAGASGCGGGVGWGTSPVAAENKHKSSSTIYFPSYLFTGDISKWSLPFLSMAALIHQFHRELYPRSMLFTTAEHLSRGGGGGCAARGGGGHIHRCAFSEVWQLLSDCHPFRTGWLTVGRIKWSESWFICHWYPNIKAFKCVGIKKRYNLAILSSFFLYYGII